MSRVSRALGTPYAGQDGANGLCGAGLGAIPSRAQNTPAALTHPHPRSQARGREELEGPQGPPLGKAASRAGRKPTAPGMGGQGAGGGRLRVWIWGAVHVHACGCVFLLAGSGCARMCVCMCARMHVCVCMRVLLSSGCMCVAPLLQPTGNSAYIRAHTRVLEEHTCSRCLAVGVCPRVSGRACVCTHVCALTGVCLSARVRKRVCLSTCPCKCVCVHKHARACVSAHRHACKRLRACKRAQPPVHPHTHAKSPRVPAASERAPAPPIPRASAPNRARPPKATRVSVASVPARRRPAGGEPEKGGRGGAQALAGAGSGRRRREVRLRQYGASKHLQTAPGTQWQIQVGNRGLRQRSRLHQTPALAKRRASRPGRPPAQRLGDVWPSPLPAPLGVIFWLASSFCTRVM